ncbi:unnamed protein product [Rhizopus microsporus]
MASKQANTTNASKKIRMTMACERCRSKKVKCDFANPQCARCQQAKAECSYDGSATQIDLFNLLKLNETVDSLQKRVQSIETDMKKVCDNTQYVADQLKNNKKDSKSKETPSCSHNALLTTANNNNTRWSLSLTPRGLRIDTNIISFHDLYDILLSGISQYELHQHDTVDSSSQSSSSTDTATVAKKKPLWKSRLKTFPLYSSWEPCQRPDPLSSQLNDYQLSKKTMDEMINIYNTCFLCLPCPNPNDSIATRYARGTLDPLLANAVFAWTARHAAIYHNLFPGQDPNQVGEPFFIKARSLIKERFMQTSVDTMHSLLIMYIYAIGIPIENKAEVESEAYIYLGLAIRMCLDLKMNQESTSEDKYEQERYRRYFWVLYFLETLGTIHTDKPFSLPPKNMITVKFPTVMEHEESIPEAKYRVEFMIHRFKSVRIFRDIIHKTAEEKPLLYHVSAIDKELQTWYNQLPGYFKYEPGDRDRRQWDTTSFKEQACIKLNFEYNFLLCQLYGLFFSKQSENEPSTIEVLSRDKCLKAARTTIELLECWNQLKQDWCHFSLENLMMVTNLYGTIVSQPDDSERETAKENLEKIARILAASPVRHHKYVNSLVNCIKNIFLESLHTNLELDTIVSLPVSVPSQIQESIKPDATSTATTTTTNTARRLHYEVTSFIPKNNNTIMIDNNNNHGRLPSNGYSEEMHFSDFVYTPTLMDYSLLPSSVINYHNSTLQCNNNNEILTNYNQLAFTSSSSQPWMGHKLNESFYQDFSGNDDNNSNSRFY